jgi:hypothetical protein
MNNKMLMGIWKAIIPVPQVMWQGVVSKSARESIARLGFMSEEHHLVRDYVVLEIPRAGGPLSPQHIVAGTGLPEGRVAEILDDLEKNMTFLYRGDGVNVSWAYPVTADRTPHHLTFSTGETVHAA